ncbi:alanine racemase [Parvibaculum sp.]|uniref:alanine racemase n=1 Tax=Parvibaculum sp. TaxID=2024848 RepID=UPI0025D402F5|nr:alanine racemase [Parvibaculum sp.]
MTKSVNTSRDLPADNAILTVDLDALVANYRHVRSLAGGAEVSGVVKANAYGHGLAPVGRALAGAGCKTFFVADAIEGATLRAALPDAVIYATSGLTPVSGPALRAADVRPCLGSLAEVEDWRREAKRAGRALPAALHFDTGLSRLGFAPSETAKITGDKSLLAGIDVTLAMSHLACSDEPEHELNLLQLERFLRVLEAFPSVPASFANTAGILLGPDYHFDLVRPGFGLYGGTPVEGRPNPFSPVVRAEARVLQIREVPAGATAGYGATWTADGPRRLAVLAAGYADGYFRALASAKGRGRVFVGGHYAPVAGRVSMDLLAVDVTDVPDGAVKRGDLAELIGPHVSLDEVAARAGTIGYEVLTSLGERYKRLYTGAVASVES